MASCSNWIFGCVNAQFRSICGPFAPHSREDRTGERSYASMQKTYGPVMRLQATSLFFRPLFAFFNTLVAVAKGHPCECDARSDRFLGSATTTRGDSVWTKTKYLLRDNDSKFGQSFARVAATSGIKVLRTPYQTPRANAVCERFLLSVRRECLDHFLIFHEKQLYRLLRAYVVYFNHARPHQGMRQQIPVPSMPSAPEQDASDKVIAVSVLGGLHHDYQGAA